MTSRARRVGKKMSLAMKVGMRRSLAVKMKGQAIPPRSVKEKARQPMLQKKARPLRRKKKPGSERMLRQEKASPPTQVRMLKRTAKTLRTTRKKNLARCPMRSSSVVGVDSLPSCTRCDRVTRRQYWLYSGAVRTSA